MLSKEEEHRLAACIDVARRDVLAHVGESSEYSHSELRLETILWLAKKLKETHEELKQLNFNHEQADQRLATALQVLQEANLLDKYLMLRGV